MRLRRNRADVQTDTPPDSAAFRRWFGNSKVVDADGRPLVVYHGSRNAGFDTFRRSMSEPGGSALFFSDDPAVAATYVRPRLRDARRLIDVADLWKPGQTGPRAAGLYAVYLRIENPLVADVRGEDWAAISVQRLPIDVRRAVVAVFGTSADKITTDGLVHVAERLGYDGAIIQNVADPEPSTLYVAFDPRQIKSANMNSGKYSRTDASIVRNPLRRRNRSDVQTDAPPDSAAFRRWFGNSKVVDAKGRPRVVYHGTADGGFVEFEHSKIDKHHSGFFFTSSKEVAESYGMPEPLPRRARTLPDLRTVVDIKRFVNSPENDFDGWRIVLGQSKQIVEPEVEDYGLEYTGMGAQVVTRFFPFWARNGATVDIGGDYYPPYTGLVSAVREAVRRGGPATSGVYPVYLRLLNPMVVEGRGALWSDIPFERGVYKTDQLSAIAKQRGYDGVIFRDIYDSMIAQDVLSDVYVAFDPRQIKSAVANVGTYDSENTDIRMNPTRRRSPTRRRNALGVQLRKGHPSLRRTAAFVQEWNDRDMDRVFADMGARVDVSVGSGGAHDAVSLDSLEAITYRKGAGSRALRALLDLTDKHGLTVTLTAEPFSFGDGTDLISRSDLVRFYEKFGFDFDEREGSPEWFEYEDEGYYPMVRYPYVPNPRRQ